MAPSFLVCYDRWTKHQSLKSLSLLTINEIFVGNSQTRLDEQLELNYNSIVDSILDLSKPYNMLPKNQLKQRQGRKLRKRLKNRSKNPIKKT
jgi:hypothetical protein